jgi:hypothetical protein
MESFPYQDLIDDFKKLGKDNFEIKILDELELNNETDKEITAELNELEELWIENLKDDGVSFYNKKV